jgi:siroheme synthase
MTYAFSTAAVDARPTAWQVRLHTGDPTQDGNANEVTTTLDSAYVRHAATFTITAGQAANTAAITFPVTATSYTVSYITVWDSDGANCYYIGPLSVAKTLAVGDTLSFPANQLLLSVA